MVLVWAVKFIIVVVLYCHSHDVAKDDLWCGNVLHVDSFVWTCLRRGKKVSTSLLQFSRLFVDFSWPLNIEFWVVALGVKLRGVGLLIDDSSLLVLVSFMGLSSARCKSVVVLFCTFFVLQFKCVSHYAMYPIVYPLHERIEVLLEYKYAS